MTLAEMASRNEYSVGPLLKGLHDKMGGYPAAAHGADNKHVRRILQPQRTAEVRGCVASPVTAKGDYSRLKVSGLPHICPPVTRSNILHSICPVAHFFQFPESSIGSPKHRGSAAVTGGENYPKMGEHPIASWGLVVNILVDKKIVEVVASYVFYFTMSVLAGHAPGVRQLIGFSNPLLRLNKPPGADH